MDDICLPSQFLKVIPTGLCHVKFKTDGHHFTWQKPITTIHNILVGSIYVDQVSLLVYFRVICQRQGNIVH